ncbi:TetR/AcrR family transcriptional regulator [Streptomyces noursei]|uniref:TetR/AcrR family transcriptional regulator n=1 Tax=Streptomyces noursei TaxID=1971 RepID=UPI0030F07839
MLRTHRPAAPGRTRRATTPLRKDAARDWDRIVAVARVLVDEGTPLQLNDVARRAGPGVGTVHRHFATPEALLEAVSAPCLEALADHAEQALADADAWRALEGFLLRTVEAQMTAADLVPLMCGIAHAVNVHGGTSVDRIATARRYLAALLGGLRAAPPRP